VETAVTGADLTPELIWAGYTQGYFPMTVHGNDVEWLQPYDRALFPLSGVHVSHSLRKTIRRGTYEVRFDTAFEDVVRSCMRPGENWLSEDFIRVYTEVHRQAWAHSCEAWKGGQLVGGAYGVAIGACFCAESMFHTARDASKVALWAMVEKCRELGFVLFDAQILNPHLTSLGAYEVPHDDYMILLKRALAQTTDWSLQGPPSAKRG
jgi:leucyl/phenylalanyl-tRNA--protein transferase